MPGGRVLAVNAEIAHTQELELCRSNCVFKHFLNLAAVEHFKRVGVHALDVIFIGGIGILVAEQIAVKPYLSVGAIVRIDPMDGRTLDLAAVSRIAATALGVVCCEYLCDIAVCVLYAACAFDEICALETALKTVGVQALVFRNGRFEEVVGFDVEILEKLTSRVPASGSLGLFSTLRSSLAPSG